jgi:hypothetical protein
MNHFFSSLCSFFISFSKLVFAVIVLYTCIQPSLFRIFLLSSVLSFLGAHYSVVPHRVKSDPSSMNNTSTSQSSTTADALGSGSRRVEHPSLSREDGYNNNSDDEGIDSDKGEDDEG